MMFGSYYPWERPESIFRFCKWPWLINPLVYASEGLRGALAPQFPHIRYGCGFGAAAGNRCGLLFLGLKKFHN